MILISQRSRLPFYAADVNPLVLDSKFIEYFRKNKDKFKKNNDVCNLSQIESIKKAIEEDESVATEFSDFKHELAKKLKKQENPFKNEINYANVQALGHGDIYNFIKSLNLDSFTRARFIQGEEVAFETLIDDVKKTKKTLRTSRSANQSIVGNNDSKNNVIHEQFMRTLYDISKKEGIDKFDRIVCNNNPLKWKDIKMMLLNGGKKTCIYVRQDKYGMGFELVVIDEYIAFIHFYQLSVGGDTNSDGSQNIPTNQVINSTLKIEGKEVCENLAKVFDRFNKRDFSANPSTDPSRTLLGIKEGEKEPLEDKYKKRGCLKVEEIGLEEKVAGNEWSREGKVDDYIVEKFCEWQDGMNINDKINMAIGIGIITGFNDIKLERVIAEFSDTDKKHLLEELKKIQEEEKEREKNLYTEDDIKKIIMIVENKDGK